MFLFSKGDELGTVLSGTCLSLIGCIVLEIYDWQLYDLLSLILKEGPFSRKCFLIIVFYG